MLPSPTAAPSSSSSHQTGPPPLQRRDRRATDESAVVAGAYLARPARSRTMDKGKSKTLREPGRGRGDLVAEAFRCFGEHCARNQIRVLLIDCLVMTNLFYPALSIYLQKRFQPLHPPIPPSHHVHRLHAGLSTRIRKENPLPLLSTPVLDSFFPHPPPLLPRLSWTGWWDCDGGRSTDWIASRVTDPTLEEEEDEIRVVRVGWADVGEVLDRDGSEEGETTWTERDEVMLDLVRRTAEEWEDKYRESGEGCVRRLEQGQDTVDPTGSCYILSSQVHDNTTPLSALSSDVVDDKTDLSGWVDSTTDNGHVYHSVAALIRAPAESRSTLDDRWASAMDNIAQTVGAEVFVEAEKPKTTKAQQTELWLLSRHSDTLDQATASSSKSREGTPKFVLFLYLLLFSVLGHQLSAAHKVHSRFGLAFTGIVQLCCSSVMSFSILALLGWNGWGWDEGNETSLPMYVLPFVIVVVGAENMGNLTRAVFSVPFQHSVPVRIGLGLSKVGSTIAVTSLFDLVLLSIVWLSVNVRPVREFCLFAAVVIITDWFMLHTFFLTVLSIDAQRLELADVLAAPGVASPTPAPRKQEMDRSRPAGWRRALRARTRKSGSLLLMLLSIGFIYYLTERHRAPLSTPSLYGYSPTISATAHLSAPTPFTTLFADFSTMSSAERLWRAVNPNGLFSINVVIPPASILILPKTGHKMLPAEIRNLCLPTSRIVLPRLKPLFNLFKVVVLPQAVTAGALYLVLLYLLKDADLLDAQRNRLGRGEEPAEEDLDEASPLNARSVKGAVAHMLPCSHQADIDLAASSSDGRVVVSVGIDNTICLWRFGSVAGSGTREVLQAEGVSKSDPVVALDVSWDGRLIAVATVGGIVQVWDVGAETQPRARNVVEIGETRATAVRIVEQTVGSDDPFVSRPSSPDTYPAFTVLIALLDGSVLSIPNDTPEGLIPPSEDHARVFFLDYRTPAPESSSAVAVAILITSYESTTLHRDTRAGWNKVMIPVTTGGSRITAVSIGCGMIGLGHRSGLVEVFDLSGNPVVAIGGPSSPLSCRLSQGSTDDGIKRLAIASPSSTRCTTCGTSTTDSIFVLSSTLDRIHVDRLNTRTFIGCRCSRRPSGVEDASSSSPTRLVIPPTSSRGWISPGHSPKKSPSLVPPVSLGEFPISSHGTRRLSALHRDDLLPSMNGNGGPTMAMASSITTSSDLDVELVPLGAIFAPGGGETWSVHGDGSIVIGVKRVAGGIDDAQWDCWSIDLEAPWNGTSLVVDTIPLTSLLRCVPLPSHVGERRESTVKAQRVGRILSLSGRVAFPSTSTQQSFSIKTYPPLAYVEIRPYVAVPGFVSLSQSQNDISGGRQGGIIILGLGNRLAVLTLPKTVEQPRARKIPSISSGIGASNGINGMGIGIGRTPPPPYGRRDAGEKKVL